MGSLLKLYFQPVGLLLAVVKAKTRKQLAVEVIELNIGKIATLSVLGVKKDASLRYFADSLKLYIPVCSNGSQYFPGRECIDLPATAEVFYTLRCSSENWWYPAGKACPDQKMLISYCGAYV